VRNLIFLVAALLDECFVFLLEGVFTEGMSLNVILNKCARQYGLFGEFDLLYYISLFA